MSKFRNAIIQLVRETIKSTISDYSWYFMDAIAEAPEGLTYKLRSGKTAKALNKTYFKVGDEVLVIRTTDGGFWLYKPKFGYVLPKTITTNIDYPIELAASGFPTYYEFSGTALTIKDLSDGSGCVVFPSATSGGAFNIFAKDGAYNDSNRYQSLRFTAAKLNTPVRVNNYTYAASYSTYTTTVSGFDSLRTDYVKASATAMLPATGAVVSMSAIINTAINHPDISSSRLIGGTGTWWANPFTGDQLFYVKYRKYNTDVITDMAESYYREIYLNNAALITEVIATAPANNIVINDFDASGCLYTEGVTKLYNGAAAPGVGSLFNLQSGAVFTPSGTYESGTFTTATSGTFSKALNYANYAAVSGSLVSKTTEISGTYPEGSALIDLSTTLMRKRPMASMLFPASIVIIGQTRPPPITCYIVSISYHRIIMTGNSGYVYDREIPGYANGTYNPAYSPYIAVGSDSPFGGSSYKNLAVTCNGAVTNNTGGFLYVFKRVHYILASTISPYPELENTITLELLGSIAPGEVDTYSGDISNAPTTDTEAHTTEFIKSLILLSTVPNPSVIY